MINSETKLLASLALFRELYDNEKDIYDIIAEIIEASIFFEKKWLLTTAEATNILKDTFDFEIPEAVVKTAIKNRLQKKGKITFSAGIYSVNPEEIRQKGEDVLKEFEIAQKDNTEITDALIDYIQTKEKMNIDESERNVILDNFKSFLMDNNTQNVYSKDISAFVKSKKQLVNFNN